MQACKCVWGGRLLSACNSYYDDKHKHARTLAPPPSLPQVKWLSGVAPDAKGRQLYSRARVADLEVAVGDVVTFTAEAEAEGAKGGEGVGSGGGGRWCRVG